MNYEIDITRRCNFSCPGCNHLCNVVNDPTSDMTAEDVESIVAQINELDREPQRLIVVGYPGYEHMAYPHGLVYI